VLVFSVNCNFISAYTCTLIFNKILRKGYGYLIELYSRPRVDILQTFKKIIFYNSIPNDPETKTFDIDRFSSKISSSKRSKIMLLKDTIRKLEEKFGKQIPLDKLKEEMGDMSEAEFEESVEKLKKSGDLFQPKRGFIQDVQSH